MLFRYHFIIKHWDLLTFFAVSDDIVAVGMDSIKQTTTTTKRRKVLDFENKSIRDIPSLFVISLAFKLLLHSSDSRRRLFHTATFAAYETIEEHYAKSILNESRKSNRQFKYNRLSLTQIVCVCVNVYILLFNVTDAYAKLSEMLFNIVASLSHLSRSCIYTENSNVCVCIIYCVDKWFCVPPHQHTTQREWMMEKYFTYIQTNITNTARP